MIEVRQITKEDLPALRRLSGPVKNTSDDEIDFLLSFMGIEDEEIKWFFVIGKNDKDPNIEITSDDFYYREIIDIYLRNMDDIDSLRYNIWDFFVLDPLMRLYWQKDETISERMKEVYYLLKIEPEDIFDGNYWSILTMEVEEFFEDEYVYNFEDD